MARPARTARALLCALAGFTALSAGCGDKAPSKEAFLAKADPVCKRANDAVALFAAPTNLPGVKDFAAKVADSLNKTAADVAKLEMPKGKDGQAVKALLASMKDAAAAGKAVAAPADKDDVPGTEKAANDFVAATKKADDEARAAGSTECAHGEAAATARLAEKIGPLAKEAYIAKVDALCVGARSELLKIDKPSNEAEAKDFLNKTLALGTKLHDDVKAVPAPAYDKAKLDEMFAKWDEVLSKSKLVQERFNAGDTEGADDIGSDVIDVASSFRGKASAYGFHECGQS